MAALTVQEDITEAERLLEKVNNKISKAGNLEAWFLTRFPDSRSKLVTYAWAEHVTLF